MDPLFDFKSKVIVVTGGAGLLGRKFSQLFSERGAVVLVADNNIKSAEQVCQGIGSGNVYPVELDISDEKSIISVVNQVVTRFHKIDTWINNAYPRTADWNAPFEDIPAESWRKNIDMHLNGYCFCCQSVLEIMKKQGFGSVINIASIYGIVAPDFSIYEGLGMTMPAAYAAIKGAIVNFTRYLASYYGKYSVRVNSISPGGIQNDQSDEFIKRYSNKTPLGRMGNPVDIAGAALFLASDASGYITGQNLVVDGGWSIL